MMIFSLFLNEFVVIFNDVLRGKEREGGGGGGGGGEFTIFVHADLDAFSEPAGAALVAVRLVDDARAFALGLAHVLAVTSDGTLQQQQQQQ